MRRVTAFLLCLVLLCGVLPVTVYADENAEFDGIIEINSWEEFEAAFENLPKYSYESYKMVLMKDLAMSAADITRSATSMVVVSIQGNNVEFDFNGHTLSCVDDISNTTSNISTVNN